MDAPLQARSPQPFPPAQAQGAGTDPVTTEIVRNGLIAATEEMKTNLMRTAYNMIIYEALDFTVEIVRNGVIAVTEEMKTNLMRTAYNMIIYEALDFTTGLFTPAGETV